MTKPVAVRWTVGDVSRDGFDSLRLSIWGAWKLFGRSARYAVCVNTVPLARARWLAGDVPDEVEWLDSSDKLPSSLRPYVDSAMAQGTAWKFAPLRMFPQHFELSLDNDCILWQAPPSLMNWLGNGAVSTLLAEDVARCFGRLDGVCGLEPRNSGLRGLPPGFDLEPHLLAVLGQRDELLVLQTEGDEQGLQVAALHHAGPVQVVSTREVTICSPFPPHLQELGSHGAHFVGLNSRETAFQVEGKPGHELLRDHWHRHRPAVIARLGLPMGTAFD